MYLGDDDEANIYKHNSSTEVHAFEPEMKGKSDIFMHVLVLENFLTQSYYSLVILRIMAVKPRILLLII